VSDLGKSDGFGCGTIVSILRSQQHPQNMVSRLDLVKNICYLGKAQNPDRRPLFSFRWGGEGLPGEGTEIGWGEILDQKGVRELFVV
jgi:hypothetical protein